VIREIGDNGDFSEVHAAWATNEEPIARLSPEPGLHAVGWHASGAPGVPRRDRGRLSAPCRDRGPTDDQA
jgi:hypothetical protein